MINVFVGFDEREEYGFHTFVSSLIHHSSEPVRITPIGNAFCAKLKRQEDESNDFGRVRFLIPWMADYKGWALFVDGSDMVLRGDIAELFYEMRDEYKALQVVGHDYKTKHQRKYVGTSMECENRDYARKNQSSVMLINCGSYAWRQITPSVVQQMSGAALHQFAFIPDDRIGYLPAEWNWLVDEFGENDKAKLLHWTAGIPAFPHYSEAPMADEWARAALKVTHITT